MTIMKTTRRKFLSSSGAATAALGFPSIIPSSALGNADRPAPSNRIVMGGIGIGNMGRGDHGAFLGKNDVQYVAICDVRKGAMNQGKAKTDAKYGNKDCKAHDDYRELLSRDDIDAVHIATPDHWHAQIIIEACRHGKDVFCQKPESLTLGEGSLMVETAKRYGRVVSGGSQRVLQDYKGTVLRCWNGSYGKVKSINVNVGPMSKPCNLPSENVPDDMNWEMWLGPAPWAPYNSKRCSGSFSTSGNSWRSYIDYSGGGMTDWGAHHFGGATFAVDVRELQPNEVILDEIDGKKFVSLRYPNGIEITHNKPGVGQMHVGKGEGQRKGKEVPKYAGSGGITGDFIDCVKTRAKPFRHIEYAINTMAVPHLTVAAYKLNRSLKWDAAKQEFIGDAEANRLRNRARREPWQI
ncbi:MAG TPA: Gfo/Idh/MocA family oxidoreductase [Verrucomicrobia bacterium]|nr:Gfo/Idh/MocA family oxidoreductase [Verrucomicrobiales bacterium]HIL56206.1 Gfo/Idh/MocA family oxidoreductase [Verrucomicrobiota bacterium]